MADREKRAVNRRSVLLGGTTLAASAIAAPAQLAQGQQRKRAQTQQQPAPTGRRPNILVIFGDDIGQTNVSAY